MSNQFEIEHKPFDYLADSLPKPPYVLRRFNSLSGGKKRYYYEMIGENPVLYSSLTTLIGDAYPEPFPILDKWERHMISEGRNPKKIASDRANYGTAMHVIYGDYLQGKNIPVNPIKLAEYLRTNELGISMEATELLISRNIDELCKDLLAFAAWARDFDVKPLGIEVMLRSVKHMVGTPLDLICEISLPILADWGEVYKGGDKKGKVKLTKQDVRVVVIVDFKSGKKGFFNKHALQLGIGKVIFAENYPDITIDYVYNFAPKDWKSEPDYNFKDQTNNPVQSEMYDILSLGKKRFLKKTKELKVFTGNLNIKTPLDTEKHFKVHSVEDMIIGYHKKEEAKKKKAPVRKVKRKTPLKAIRKVPANKFVQCLNPRTKTYVKVNVAGGNIVASKTTPYKNVEIVESHIALKS